LRRRDEILNVAGALFAERGYAGTSMRDLSQATGLLAGSLYTHFRSKLEMLDELTSRYYAALLPRQEAVVATSASGAARFRTLLHVTVEHTADHRNELSILHYCWAQIRAEPGLEHIRALSTRSMRTWSTAIAAGIDDGSLRTGMSVELLTRMVPGAIHSLLDAQRYPERSARLRTHSVAEVIAVLEGALLSGLLPDGTPLPELVAYDDTLSVL
jgi:AcrR family transcriptional regulator